MNKRFIIFGAAILTLVGMRAQTGGIDAVLQQIEANNKELQANSHLISSQKLENRVDNNLPDPTLSYAHLWDSKNSDETVGELVISQSFDFPPLYATRGQMNRLKTSALDAQATAFRQQILLQAKEVCLDIIMLQRQQTLLDERLKNAEELSAMYTRRMETGDANALETNKINLELLNVRTEARLNQTALNNKLKELLALNGNQPLTPGRPLPKAQAVSVVCAVAMLLKKHLPFQLKKTDFRLNLQCRKFLDIGLPLALQEFLTQVSFLALCAFVNRLGLEASSGYGVACKIVNFAMLIPSSLMQSMASFVSQNVGADNKKRARQTLFTGIAIGLVFGCAVFALVWFEGDLLSGIFTTDAAVIVNAFAYLRGFAPETIVTAVLFSMVGYFNGNNKTVWVMVQGLVQTLLVRLPMAYIMSIQPNASLTMIGLAAPTSTAVGIVLNVCFFLYLERKEKNLKV